MTGNSIFQDCNTGGKCLPGQLDLESSAVSATKGRIRKAVTGENGSQRNSLTIGKKLKTFIVPAVKHLLFPRSYKTCFLTLCIVFNINYFNSCFHDKYAFIT